MSFLFVPVKSIGTGRAFREGQNDVTWYEIINGKFQQTCDTACTVQPATLLPTTAKVESLPPDCPEVNLRKALDPMFAMSSGLHQDC